MAPYEADAQMAFLERTGIVDGLITEDSDLLVFGCKQVLFKLDSDGNCVCIRRENFARVTELPLSGWGDKEFREMAVSCSTGSNPCIISLMNSCLSTKMLSGCDYLPSIPGLGLKTSHKLLRRYKTVERVLNAIRLGTISAKLKFPSGGMEGYLKDFRIAELAFLYQRAFDPRDGVKRLVHLTEVPDSLKSGGIWDDRYVGE